MPKKVKFTVPWFSSPSTDPAQTASLLDGQLMIPMISCLKPAASAGNAATHATELLP